MVDSERGLDAPGDLVLDYRDLGTGLPPRPRLRIGSPRLLSTSARHPRSVTPMVALAALLPPGRNAITAVGELVSAAHARDGDGGSVGSVVGGNSVVVGGGGGVAQRWPTAPALRVVAMDYDTGDRVMFGAPDAPDTSVADAVMASCAIPGWYAPIDIGGRRFVDGGTRSPGSLDLLVDVGLDEILVLAPACAIEPDRPRGGLARVERRVRRTATRRLMLEVAQARAAGIDVVVATPGPDDLEAIGGNVMDATRRSTVFEVSLRTSTELFEERRQRRTPRPASAQAELASPVPAVTTAPASTGRGQPDLGQPDLGQPDVGLGLAG
jgi:NTE family protein